MFHMGFKACHGNSEDSGDFLEHSKKLEGGIRGVSKRFKIFQILECFLGIQRDFTGHSCKFQKTFQGNSKGFRRVSKGFHTVSAGESQGCCFV